MSKNTSLRKLLLAAMCFAFMILSAKAQSSLITNAHAAISPDSANVSSGEFTVLLEDTANVSQVNVMLGSEADSTNLVAYTFNYDVTTSLPAGFSYTRAQSTLTLSVGTFNECSTYYGAVIIKDASGSWRPVYKFITN